MSNDRDLQANLSFNVDRQSVNESNRAADGIKKRVEGLGGTATTMGKRYTEAAKQVKQGFRDAADEARRLQQVNDKLEAQAKRQKQQAQTQATQRGGQLAGGALSQVGGSLGDAGGVVSQGTSQFGGLGPAALAAGVALGVVTKAFEDVQKRARESARVILDAQESAIRLQQEGTQAQVAERIKQLEAERAVQQRIRANAEQNIEALEQGVRERFGGIGEALTNLSRTLGTEGSFGELEKGARDASTSIQGINTELVQLNALLNDEAVIQRQRGQDAIARAQEVADLRQIEQQASTATAEANRLRIDALNQEAELIRLQISTIEESGAVTDETTAKLEELNAELTRVGQTTQILSKFTTDAAAGQEERAKAEQDTLNKLTSIYEQYNNALVNAARQATQRAEDINRRAQDDRRNATQQLGRDLTDLERRNQRQRFEVTAEAAQREAEEYRKHLTDLEKIQRDGQKSRQDALRNFDFLGAFRIEEQTSQRLKEATDDFSREREERAISSEIALQDLQASLVQEQEERRLQYRRQLQDLKASTNQQLRDAQIAQRRQIEEARNAQITQLNQLSQFWQQFGGITRQALQGILQQAGSAAQNAGGGGGGGTTNINNARNTTTNNQSLRLTVPANATSSDIAAQLARLLGV